MQIDLICINSETRHAMVTYFQLIVVTLGMITNLTTVVTLTLHGSQQFCPMILFLFKHQSIVDAFTCLFALILLVQKSWHVFGILWLDTFICHIWYSQFLYWGSVYMSGWNLAFISRERYLGVCRPLQYQKYTKKKVVKKLAMVYLSCLVFSSLSLLQTRMINGQCCQEPVLEGEWVDPLYKAYAVIVFVTQYGLPCVASLIFYGCVIYRMHKRRTDRTFGTNNTIERATSQLTKTAIVVTTIFVICVGFDAWYFMLGSLGFVDYIFYTPLQKFSVALSSVNSACNPLVYCILLRYVGGVTQKVPLWPESVSYQKKNSCFVLV